MVLSWQGCIVEYLALKSRETTKKNEVRPRSCVHLGDVCSRTVSLAFARPEALSPALQDRQSSEMPPKTYLTNLSKLQQNVELNTLEVTCSS